MPATGRSLPIQLHRIITRASPINDRDSLVYSSVYNGVSRGYQLVHVPGYAKRLHRLVTVRDHDIGYSASIG